MKAKLILAVALVLGLSATSAKAQSITSRERHERQRINEGRRNGDLTRGESFRLSQEQRHLHNDMRRARLNDGHIGPRERAHIRREERRYSRDIYRAKHNRRHHRF